MVNRQAEDIVHPERCPRKLLHRTATYLLLLLLDHLHSIYMMWFCFFDCEWIGLKELYLFLIFIIISKLHIPDKINTLLTY